MWYCFLVLLSLNSWPKFKFQLQLNCTHTERISWIYPWNDHQNWAIKLHQPHVAAKVTSTRGSQKPKRPVASTQRLLLRIPSKVLWSYMPSWYAIRTFNLTIQVRTSRAINSIALGHLVPSLSFDSIEDVTECLLEIELEVIKIIFRK